MGSGGKDLGFAFQVKYRIEREMESRGLGPMLTTYLFIYHTQWFYL